MKDRVALQLYSVRDYVGQVGYEAAIRKVADLGYRNVETAGFPGTTAQAAKALFDELGLTVVAAHVGLPIGEQKNAILEQAEALGKPYLVCTQIGPNDVQTMDSVKNLCERLNLGYAAANEAGLRFAIHNHWWEFGMVDGRRVHDVMLELLDPGVLFEVDTYWVQVGGNDPVEVVRSLGKRAPLLHIKDGPANREEPMTAVGEGVMNIPAIIAAAGSNAEWLVVELDQCGTDMLEAVGKSVRYMRTIE